MLNVKTSIRRNSHLIARKMEKEFIIIDFNKGKFYKLNRSGEVIWKYLWQPRKIQDVVKKIMADFDVDFSQAKRDTLSFIKKYLNDLFYKVD